MVVASDRRPPPRVVVPQSVLRTEYYSVCLLHRWVTVARGPSYLSLPMGHEHALLRAKHPNQPARTKVLRTARRRGTPGRVIIVVPWTGLPSSLGSCEPEEGREIYICMYVGTSIQGHSCRFDKLRTKWYQF